MNAAAAVLFPDLEGHWFAVSDADPRAAALYHRHYSSKKGRPVQARKTAKFTGPGEYLALLSADCTALFVWRKERFRLDDQTGINCSIFRNEGGVLSSLLIQEASGLAWERWPGERLYTFVWDAKVKSVNPGYCFKRAGWKVCGRNADGRLTILEILPPTDTSAPEPVRRQQPIGLAHSDLGQAPVTERGGTEVMGWRAGTVPGSMGIGSTGTRPRPTSNEHEKAPDRG